MLLLHDYLVSVPSVAQITINRPERRNAFRSKTVKEMSRAFEDARDDVSIGVVILTGKVGIALNYYVWIFSISS